MSTPAELRAKYWRMKALLQERGITPTLDREVALLQIELQAEIAAQMAETNELLKRTLGLLNMEELLLELDRFFKEKK